MRNIFHFRKQECLDGKHQSDKTLSCENVKDPALVCEDIQRKHSPQNLSADHEKTSKKTYVYPMTLHLLLSV